MSTLLQFVFESTLIMGVFALLYSALFRSETNFVLVRKLMVAGLLLSLVVPFIDFRVNNDILPGVNAKVLEIWLPEVGRNTAADSFSDVSAMQSPDILTIILIVYSLGAFFYFIRFSLQVSKLIRVLRLPARAS